ncbi:nitrilase-related carbon-nitrogen hydrolase [Uliginosibacterium sp. sgz301328]|uniref:nitrilase-related carbon-nitrogen hydrolase n=1 Tax=Uliginosibacterium sp. sgz301328 TaxID=3243764 RepID=UPI00359E2E7D
MAQPGLKIGVLQFDAVVGDIAGNAARIHAAAVDARKAGAGLLLTPELALCGYPPDDLLLREAFLRRCEHELGLLAMDCQGIDVVVGHPCRDGDLRYNAASVLRDGKVLARYHKHRLPNYGVFDEARYFASGDAPCVFESHGMRIGINICADIWDEGAADAAREAGAELLLVLNASPYHVGKLAQRLAVLGECVDRTGIPALYCNLVGGQDDLLFDGGSFALHRDGTQVFQAAQFVDTLEYVTYADGMLAGSGDEGSATEEAEIYAALVLGLRDHVAKNSFEHVLLGLSGALDSALALCVAVDAVGAARVHALLAPVPADAHAAAADAALHAERLGVRCDPLPLEPMLRVFDRMLTQWTPARAGFDSMPSLQARAHGASLSALAHHRGALLLSYSTKTTLALGVPGVYHETASDFALFKDVSLSCAQRLVAYRAGISSDVPARMQGRQPAGLPMVAGGVATLDDIIQAYLQFEEGPAQIVASGVPPEDLRAVLAMLRQGERNGGRLPPGPCITRRGFGRGWRMPQTHGFGAYPP